mmetsp:Transcript_8725/g.16472  ORF Transcript_8725/g.16472 Transcript_8725/m.16472 type:complete len:775 (-) Transcript_8725:55-2379(-)
MKWLNRVGGNSLARTKTQPVRNSTAPPLGGGTLIPPLHLHYSHGGEGQGVNTRPSTRELIFQNDVQYYSTIRTVKGATSILGNHCHSFITSSPSSAVFLHDDKSPSNGMTVQSIRKFHIKTTTATTQSLKNNQTKDKMTSGQTKLSDNADNHRDSVMASGDLSSDEIQLVMDQLLTKAYKESRTISKLIQHRRKQYLPLENQMDAEATITSSINDDSSRMSEPVPVQKNHEEQRQSVLEDLRDETNVVETLLAMTSHQYFPQALEKLKERKQSSPPMSNGTAPTDGDFGNTTNSWTIFDMDVSVSLHCTFLSVVHWLSGILSSLPPNARSSISMKGWDKVSSSRQPHSSSKESNRITYDTSVPLEYLTTKESILLAHILDLAERMRELNLPLTIPQYQMLMTMIARHSSGVNGEVSMILLNMSNTACQIFGSGALKADFFVGALKELIGRNHFRDAIMLLQGMKNIHGINGVPLQDGIDLLNFLKMRVDDFIAERLPLPEGFDEADAVELSLILQRPIMIELKATQKALESQEVETANDEWNHAIGSLVDEYEDDESYEEIHGDISSTLVENENDLLSACTCGEENEPCAESDLPITSGEQMNYEGFLEDLQKLNELVDSMESSKDDDVVKKQANELAISIIENIKRFRKNEYQGLSSVGQCASNVIAKKNENPWGIATRVNVDPSTGEIDNLEISFMMPTPSKSEKYPERTRNNVDIDRNEILEFIYCRDETWEIPDIVSQLEEWNGNKKILFTKEYEDEIFNSLSNSDDGDE